MGCHTWFYNRLEIQPTYEELRKSLLDHYTIEKSYYERHVAGTLSEDEAWLFEYKSVESSLYVIKIIDRLYRIVEKRLCQIATMRHATMNLDIDFCERNHQFYERVNEHDIFRIYTYPKDELLSMDETLAFLKRNETRIFWGSNPTLYGRDAVIQKLEDFWYTYPNGRITFG